MPSRRCTCDVPTPRWRATHRAALSISQFSVEPFEQERDLDGILLVEEESFTNPWTRAMYAWELQNPEVCHIYVVRTPECRVAGFCAFWLVVDESARQQRGAAPGLPGQGAGLGADAAGADRGPPARRGSRHAGSTGVERWPRAGSTRRMGFEVTATRPRYYTDPTEDALILWRELT